MKNLLFFLWMLLFPIIQDMADYIVWKTKWVPRPEGYYSNGYAAIFELAIYFLVGVLLYER